MYSEILEVAEKQLDNLKGKTIDVLEISRPMDIEYAKNLSKVISKLSPLIGNMIEFSMVEYLNHSYTWEGEGRWLRQDPGFPDAIFKGNISPMPGIEIKTWFPLSTEVTARFRESIARFTEDNILVAVVAWLPEHLLFGKPQVIDIWTGSAKSLALARDKHYHNPPDYLVFEPEDTSLRTQNLQQTNANGYKFQGSANQLRDAERLVQDWGTQGKEYDHAIKYQTTLKELLGRYPYRLDTNFAKIDRIGHPDLENFKTRVLNSKISGYTIDQWRRLLLTSEQAIASLISDLTS